ncbi:tape measure protein [Cohnella hongkongensis]|uniref:Tape measure protein n=1 Tax=Cohnella hongkongensis TaxID=178337 RepID=A0ABV9FLH7_9BACL
MATVTSALGMMNQLSRALDRVTGRVYVLNVALERTRRLVERPAILRVSLNTTAVRPIRVRVHLDTAQALARAAALRLQILSRIGTITASVQLSSNLTSMLSQLIGLVRQLSEAVRNIPPLGGGGGGSGGGSGGSGGGSSGGGGGGSQMLKKLLASADLKSAMRISDEYMTIRAKLDFVNDGLQTTEQLQQKVFAAAGRSRVSYADMAQAVGRMGAASGAFGSKDEVIAFAETAQKSFRISGADAGGQQAGMQQLSQAMVTGKLEGEGFRSILENAPMLAQAIANYTGQSQAELLELSKEGRITADILKNAMFAATDEINQKFELLPLTFGDVRNQIQNDALRAFGPVIEQINGFLNSDVGASFIHNIGIAVQAAALLLEAMVTGIEAIANAIAENWPIIEPILVALGSVLLAVIIVKIWTVTAALYAQVAALYAQAAAWMAAYWPVVLIVMAIVAIIYALIKMGVTADQIVGFIVGLFRGLYTFYTNFTAMLYNIFASFAEFFKNFLNHPVYSAKRLFANFVNSVLDMVKKIAEAIDWVFGSDLAGGLTSLQQQMSDWVGEMPEGYKVVQRMEQKSLVDEAKKGYDAGSSWMKGVSGKLKGFNLDKLMEFGAEAFAGFGDNPHETPNIGKVGEVGRINNTVDISSEDLKMMRELAEMKNIQNFVSLTPSISFGDTHIRNESDLDTIIMRITDSLNQDIAASADAAYG